MSLLSSIKIAFALAVASQLAGLATSARATERMRDTGISPALCSAGDIREPGIQGEVPAGQTANYNCGVKVIGQLTLAGNVQGIGTCAYVRTRGQGGTPNESQISVVDVSDPTKPVVVGSPLPVHNGTETFRVVVTGERAILVSGSSVYDISDCQNPQLAGEIKWPDTPVPGVSRKNFPHDMRVNHTGTRVFASFGVWDADIANLKDPSSWKVTDHRCELAAQIPGPWQEVHRQSIKAGHSLCDDATMPAPRGSDYQVGTSPLQASLLWPQVSHSPDLNADDTRLYVGDQAGGHSALWAPEPKVRIIDVTKRPYTIIGEVGGPGHGLDWIRVGDHEYVLHSNEGGTKGIDRQPEHGDTCKPHPRPTALGWGFEVIVSDVTDPAHAQNVSMIQLAINSPEYCNVRQASGRDPWIAYHLVDNPMNAKFAAVNFGEAGLRIFDIRDPLKPSEVAYFNHGSPVHAGVGYYDSARKLIYFSDAGGFKVLQIELQVRARLGL